MYLGTRKESSEIYQFKNVQYAKPIHAVVLIFSSMALFAFINLLGALLRIRMIDFILGLIVTPIYFILLNKKFVRKTADFNLSLNRLEWNENHIDFSEMDYYKIHWGQGANLKFKLKNKKTIKLMSSPVFCNNTNEFVSLCSTLDRLLHNNGVGQIKKKTLSETSFYRPLIASLSILASGLFIYGHLRNAFILPEVLLIFIMAFAIFWIWWKEKKGD